MWSRLPDEFREILREMERDWGYPLKGNTGLYFFIRQGGERRKVVVLRGRFLRILFNGLRQDKIGEIFIYVFSR